VRSSSPRWPGGTKPPRTGIFCSISLRKDVSVSKRTTRLPRLRPCCVTTKRLRGLAWYLHIRIIVTGVLPALERAEALKIRTIKLDATEQGETLYKHFGFAREQAIERWCRGPLDRQRRTASNSEPPANCPRGDFQADIDKDAFGANRSNLLAALLRRGACFSNSDGYVFTRSGRNTTQLGPCVAAQKNEASKLLKSAMETFGAPEWSWDLLPQNLEAISLATEFGFLPNRRLVRMWRGEELRPKEQLMYATAGFEFG